MSRMTSNFLRIIKGYLVVGKITHKANLERTGVHNVRKSDIRLLINLASTTLSFPSP
jgi:hypothetical protein